MKNIALEDAVSLLVNHTKQLETYEDIPLFEGENRVLAKSVTAKINQPPFDRSPLDGYAIRGEDSKGASQEQPITLKVVDEVHAGFVSHYELQKGEAIRIMTGAPMPKGSNCVIRQEDTDYGVEAVELYKEVKPFANYCYAGEDYKAGSTLCEAGEILTAYHLGLLASAGLTTVAVVKKPRIGLLSTGDELAEPGAILQEGKIYNSSLYTLGIRLKQLGCEPVILGNTGDSVEDTCNIIRDNYDKVDLFITTGGVSVGKKDIMHPVLESLQAKRLFWRLKLKPGTPALAGMFEDKMLLCLSGNPSAACITFELLFRDILVKLTGAEALGLKKKEAVLTTAFNKKSPNRRFLRAHYEDGKVSLITNNHSSGVLGSMIGCNCLIDIPAGDSGIEKDTQVTIHIYL